MGLFDGAGSGPAQGKSRIGSPAFLAKTLGIPVILVLNAKSQGHFIAALDQGFANFDPELKVATKADPDKLTGEASGRQMPSLIIGLPVGFVNAEESKEVLLQQNMIPCLTLRGRKGGSTLAAAVVNALAELALRA